MVSKIICFVSLPQSKHELLVHYVIVTISKFEQLDECGRMPQSMVNTLTVALLIYDQLNEYL